MIKTDRKSKGFLMNDCFEMLYPKNSTQRAGIAAGGIFYNNRAPLAAIPMLAAALSVGVRFAL